MKKGIIFTMLALMAATVVSAQVHLYLDERQVQLEDGPAHGWVFPVVQSLDEALKDLDDFCKDRSDIRMKKSGNEMMVAEKVSIPAIATKRGDLIGYGHSSGTEYTLALIFKLGYDISVNSEEWESEMNNFHNYARQFMAYHYEQAYDRRMEEIADQIKELEKEKERFEKDIDQLNRKIDNNSKRIEKETDQAKIDEYTFENTAYGEEIAAITNLIPPIESKLQELRERSDQLNTEAHTYLGTIGSL